MSPPDDRLDEAPGARPGAGGGRGGNAEPTVLLVGADKSFHGAIAAALSRYGVYVETTAAHGVVDAVVASAPDLVLLVGDAASDGGSSVLAHLYTTPHSSVVPVAILADETALDERLRAFRHGAAAVIPRSASVDAIAERVAKLAREIPERDGGTVGYVGEATLDELVQALSKELRSGILSVRGPKGTSEDTIRVVLGGGRPLAQTIDEFVSRIRKHVVHAEPLQYEFDERAGGTVQLLGADALDPTAGSANVAGLRILLADEDAARADAVAQALRGHDATVVVTDFDPPEQRFARLRQLDPAILLIDEPGLAGAGYDLVRRMRRDTRLRWASLLVARWDEIWSDTEGAARITRILGTLAALAEPERALRERIGLSSSFDTRLEITGPSRLVRAAAASKRPVRITVHNPRLEVRVELSDQLVAGARADDRSGGPTLEGAVALSALMGLGTGRVRIEPLPEAQTVNIMSPVDDALNLADGEASPIQPSIPPTDSIRPEASASYPPDSTRRDSIAARRRAIGVWTLVGFASVIVGTAIAVLIVSAGKKAPEPSARKRPVVESPAAATATPAAPTAANAPAAPPTPPAEKASAAPVEAASAAPPSKAAEAPPTDSALPPDASGEVQQKAPTCEQAVGPSWSLLGNDQPSRALREVGFGRRALMLGKMDDAEVAYCRAVVLDPTRPEPFLALVRIFLLRHDAGQAREWAERAAKQHPGNQDVQSLYGDALARAGDVDRAREIWLSLAHIDPSDTAAVRNMAYTFVHGAERAMKAADNAQADRLFRRSILLDPTNALGAAGLARVLLVRGENAGALTWAKRAVSLAPHDPELRVLLGDVAEKNGDLVTARTEWKSAYDIDPGNYKAASRMLRASK
ncbi:MAG TPA: tetratricopeptide repeat protein [Polyangiaceae bacterium]|nr:tetratricopeptide repeat protein [Polyangiaceae bacterium]